ncbi:MAG: ABC transporter substrate-binding protein [Bryobacteraceae bacterium]
MNSLTRRNFAWALSAAGVLAGCSKAPQKIRLALNWKPEPEFGGYYAAPYQKHGLDVEILPGGAGTPTVQMIGAGSTEFGIVSGDELIIARSRGNDVVGLFAVFQHDPLAIMAHASRKAASLADVFKGGTVALQKGLAYARMLEKKYGFDKVKIVPSPGGDITTFLHDPMFAQQCFLTAEPLIARQQGADVQVFRMADEGYDPYSSLMATSGEYLRKKPETVAAMVAAVREGMRSYLDNPKTVNEKMNALNPSMSLTVFNQAAEAQRPLVETDEAKRNGVGSMTKERWDALIAQLKDLGDIPSAIPAEECFRNL